MRKLYKILATILFLMAAGQSRASNIDAICKILKQKDYNKLNKYIDDLGKGYDVTRLVERELMPGSWEVKIKYDEFYPTENPNVTDVYSYYIEIITEKSKIIYCCFSDHKYLNAPETILDYKVDTKYKKLSDAYREAYGAAVNFSHLFIDNDSVVYGSHCGITGRNPIYRTKLDDAVTSVDTPLLSVWLSGTITELQVYAVDGFYQLKEKGIVPNKKILKRINLVKSKKGRINQCSGCMYINWEISDITKEFKF